MAICYSSQRKLIQQGGRKLSGWCSGEMGASAPLFTFSKAPTTGSDLFYPSLGSQAGLTLSVPSVLCTSKECTPGLPWASVPSCGMAPLSSAGL